MGMANDGKFWFDRGMFDIHVPPERPGSRILSHAQKDWMIGRLLEMNENLKTEVAALTAKCAALAAQVSASAASANAAGGRRSKASRRKR